MKTQKNKSGLFASLFILAGLCANHAHAQSEVRNGGDTQEKRFNQIADDLKDWISQGGAEGLKLAAPIDRALYETKMMEALLSYTVSFTLDTINVNGVEKDCENIPATKIIRCNIDRFKNSSEAEQYTIVHHELAGIAGLENNEGKARSNYSISDQITSSLEKVTVLKLVVKKNSTISSATRQMFLQAKGISLDDFLNRKDPVEANKDQGRWKCYDQNGKFMFNILAVRNGDSSAITYGTTGIGNFHYNKRIGTMVEENPAGVEVILRKLSDTQLIVEASYQASKRKMRKFPDHQRSVFYPDYFSNYFVCNPRP